MTEFNYKAIELPENINYDELYDYLKDNNEELERIVDEFLEKDPKWLENERKIQELVQKRENALKDLKLVEENNKKFDELVKEMEQMNVNKRTITITDVIQYDDNYTYYSSPIQRVIDIDELRKRMNSTSIDVKKENKDNSEPKQSTSGLNTIKETQTESSIDDSKDKDLSELTVVYDGLTTAKKVVHKVIQKFDRIDPKVNSEVFAASNGILTHCWKPAKITRVQTSSQNLCYCSVAFHDRAIVGGNLLSKSLIAYTIKSNSLLPVGERVVAYLSDSSSAILHSLKKELYSGTVAEPAKYTNGYRFLIFFDKHAYRYVKREDIYHIYEKCSVENIFTEKDKELNIEIKEYADFLRRYIKNYPERPMLRMQRDDRIKIRLENKWEIAKVLDIDASLALITFERLSPPRTEWIYRGSRRLAQIQKECTIMKTNVKHRAGRSTTRITRRLDQRPNQAFVEWNTEETEEDKENESTSRRESTKSDDEIVILDKEETNRKRKFKQTARKSTARPAGSFTMSCDPMKLLDQAMFNPIEVSVEKLPDLQRVIPKPFITHHCSSACIDSVAEESDFYDFNPYHIPISVGYRREIIRINEPNRRSRVIYRAPCGRRLRNIFEVLNYIRVTESTLDIDLFTFSSGFALFRKSSPLKARFYIEDITKGTERQPISCVNTVDETDLGNVVYKNERFPHPDVNFKIDPEFLSCCDCVDNCAISDNCSCQQLTRETSNAIRMSHSRHEMEVGYEYKRLNDFIMTGTFECNANCPCNERCPNRVVQNGIKCRLQLFKTLKKGWGVRVLHDVPKGAFLCIYAAQILNEDAADKEGKTFGDEYLADLDYIDVCENQKEGYESDVEESDADYDQSEEEYQEEDDDDDEDYRYYGKKSRSNASVTEMPLEENAIIYGGRKRNDDKSKSRYSIREDFFKEDFCYSLDAKKMGNIGRYLNHSCEPNCFVQNVFVDTHDLRFPWVSFFAKKDILAYEELTWDYNYEIGSIPGRKMPCYCGAHRCKKRLL